MQLNRSERGDTIIEAILALSIFSLVTVSMFAIMQRGMLSAYDALERSQVRLIMNRQSELLQYARDSYVKVVSAGQVVVAGTPAHLWSQINSAVIPSLASAPALDTCTPPSGAFYIVWDSTNARYVIGTTHTTVSGLPSEGSGLWVVKHDPPGFAGKRRYHDFYIMSCWHLSTSQDQMMSTIVRMHEP